MANKAKKADNKTLDALKGQKIKGEKVKGGITVTLSNDGGGSGSNTNNADGGYG